MEMDARIVLIEPSHPGNIGAAARALRVMGLRELVLVRPHAFPHADATAMAAGADDILAQARVCTTLDEALADARLVFGTSARRRSLAWPECDARAAAASATTEAGPAAFLFGRERSGLTNAELDTCHCLLHVPTANDYGSLNLAQAVQIVAYELRMATVAAPTSAPPSPPAPATGEPMPTHEDMQRLYTHLETTLTEIGFLDPDNPRLLMRRLRRFFHRSRPSALEVNILRGMLRAAQAPASSRPQDSRSPTGGATIPDRADQESGDG